MSDEEKLFVPRRKALLTTASIGGAAAGLSTGVLADNESSTSDQSDAPRPRPADVPDEWLTDENEFDIPQEVLNDIEPRVYDPETGREVEDIVVRAVNPREIGPYEERRPAKPEGGVRFSETIFEASAGGHTMKIDLEVVASLSSMEASIALIISISGFVYELVSFSITQDDERAFCFEQSVPGQIPVSTSLCPDALWEFGSTQFSFGLTGELCLGLDCPVVTCEVCRGVGVDVTVDIENANII